MKSTTSFWPSFLLLMLITIMAGCSDRNHSPPDSSDPLSEGSRSAVAAVAVAKAALAIADEQPLMPDTPPRPSSPAPDSSTDHQNEPQQVSRPLRMEFPDGPVLSEPLPAQLVVGHWKFGCPAGERQERDLRRVLQPLGWTIGAAATDQIQFVNLSPDESCPQLTLFQNGSILKSWIGYQDPSLLSHELRRAWDSSPSQVSQATAGSSGAIHARSQIAAMLAWWRANIGMGTRVTLEWDRTGAQTLPLLARSNWSTAALFGKSGRFEVTASGTHLPTDTLGFAYRILDDDVTIDLDPIRLHGIAAKLNPPTDSENQAVEPLVTGIGAVTIWTMFSIVRDVVSLLNPSCDLQLPGNLSATAELSGDMLSIDFPQPPSVKLVALFTFQLSVARVEITPQAVRLLFGGSRVVKERSFLVK